MNNVLISLIEEENNCYLNNGLCDGGEDGGGSCDCDSDGSGYE